MSARGQGRLERIGRWILGGELVFAGLALGSLHTVVLAVTAVLAFGAMAALWLPSAPLRARPAATTLVVLAIVLLGYTALQALPLPAALVAAVAPENADIWARALSPLHEPGPAWTSLSLDPAATRIELLRGSAYLFTMLAALRVAQRQDGVVFLERAIVVAGVAMAIAAAIHPAFGAQKVFGAYEPVAKYAFAPKNLSPLLNTNHLAAYVNIAFCVAFATTLRHREPPLPLPIAGAATAVLVATNLWARSRGGAAAMLLGTMLVAGLSLFARRNERRRLLLVLVPSAALVVASVMAGLAMSEEARQKLTHTDASKLRIPLESLALLQKSAITGIGRGAFESVFPAVRRTTGHWVFTHPENVMAQWSVEWGVPIALLAVVAIAWALRPASMMARSHPPVGAWVAIVVVGLQNLVDFSSEVPGVMVLLAACAAIVVGGSAGGARTSRIEVWSSRPKLLVGSAAGLLVVALGSTLPFTSHELAAEQRHFQDLGVDKSVTKSTFDVEARAAMLRHPAEPYFAFVGALRATVVRDDAVVPWAARALERSPVNGRTHLLLARTLWLRRPAQARLEYRLAVEQDPNLWGFVAKEVGPLVGNADEALEVAPASREGLSVLEELIGHIALRLPATAVQVDREIMSRDPLAMAPVRRLAAGALADLRDGASWCGPAGSECLAAGVAAAERVREGAREQCEGHVLVAKLEVAAGDVEQGLHTLERAVDTAADKTACAKALVEMALGLGQRLRGDAALERLTRLGCVTAQECVDNLVFAAETERSRGNTRKALAHYKSAAERAPERDDLLETVAGLASSQGLPGEALDAYNRLAQRHPGEARFAQAAAAAREAVQRNLANRLEGVTR